MLVSAWAEDLRFRFEESRKRGNENESQKLKRVGSTAAGQYIKEHDEEGQEGKKDRKVYK